MAEAMFSSTLKLCIIKLALHFDTGSLGKTHNMQNTALLVLWAVIVLFRKVLVQPVIILRRCQKDSLSKNMNVSGPWFWWTISLCIFNKFLVAICADYSCLIFKDLHVYRLTPKSLHYTTATQIHLRGTICTEVHLLLLFPLEDTRLFGNVWKWNWPSAFVTLK